MIYKRFLTLPLQRNTGQLDSSDAGNDLNVERAWLQGLTGCGTVVAIVDDGMPDMTMQKFLQCFMQLNNAFIQAWSTPTRT